MKASDYVYGCLLSVFLSLLDEKEKRRPAIVKINDAIRRVHHKPKLTRCPEYYKAADIVEYAIKESWKEIPEGKDITINAIAFMIYNRHKDEMKHYKINIKHLNTMSRIGVSGHALSTAKVLNIIEEKILEKLNQS